LIAAGLVLVAIVILSYQTLTTRADAADAMNRTNAVRFHLQVALNLVIDAETGNRGYLLTGDQQYLEPYDRAKARLQNELATLHLLVDDSEAKQQLASIERVAAERIQRLDEGVELERSGRHADAVAGIKTARGLQLMEQLRGQISALADDRARLGEERDAAWTAAVRLSSYVVFGGTAVLFATLLLLGFFASRDFRMVEADAWIRRVQVALAGELQNDQRLESVGEKALEVVTSAVDAQVGAVYVVEGKELRRVAGHALDASSPASVPFGEGLAGQAAKDGTLVHLRAVPADYLRVASAVGASRPAEVVIAPAIVDGEPQAVVELAFMRSVGAVERMAIERAVESVAISVRAARDRSRLEDLLEETQRQAEELQAQQEELRVTNEELEQQTRTLQLSQAQLENQQSELEQINAQLEAHTKTVEERRDELARAGKELQRANEYKSQFLANMSHELRTPLNSSLILAKLLADNRKGNLDEEQIQFARTIYSAGNDLLTLINDILDLSKIEAGMLDVRTELVHVKSLAEELANTFRPIAADKHLELAILTHAAPESLETDPTRLQQILRNLISNALKFTEEGSVTLAISAAGDKVTFAVTDTGIGIAPDQHSLVFEAFRQADGGSNRKFGGTGLGLSISRDLARLLGGDLRLTSAVGRGSTFTLELPMHAPAANVERLKPVPARAPAEPALAPAPFADDRERVTPQSRSLLIVEDDVAFARVLVDLAHEREFLALAAVNAADALVLARRYTPSAIVLDIALPDRSGLAVLDALKRDPSTRHIPVHIVSATDYTRTALEMGAVGYALKPIEREQLLEAIEHLETKFTQKLRRVLVVEDDPVARESTAKLLATEGVEIATAGTAASALEQLKASTFDCMVLDLSLPDRSGLELLSEMSRGEQYSFPPVIVYTGRALSKDEVHELEKFSRSIIIKGARSPERLLDEVTLFLHQVEAELPAERQRMLRDARDREAVFEGRKILVVEDDVRNVFALSAVLEPKGAHVEIARNGKEAIAKLHDNPEVDLVLMDIMMPEMDGLEATRRLRTEPRFAKLPIIALTAKAMIDDREKCLEAGANDYIAKPLDVDKLVSLARVWIRK
jgi:CheY-like chemotaxis protein/signal transduction histidine kinase/CHASE3 domain sensor protein